MSILCRFGIHSWTACKCTRCGEMRDREHRWEWCRCTVCGKTRNSNHNWSDESCLVCGELTLTGLAKQWADKLKKNEDYHALAAYLCSYGSYLGDSTDLWNAKRSFALKELSDAGPVAVDAILTEIEKGDYKDDRIADILIEIGDTKAVPVLKKLLDRGEWDAIGGMNEHVKEFIDKYPQLQGEVEKATCAICGKSRAVTEMKRYDDKRFCEDTCWSKRGRVVKTGAGTGCSYYEEGICMADGRDSGVCSLGQGSYQNCYVYRSKKEGPHVLFEGLR